MRPPLGPPTPASRRIQLSAGALVLAMVSLVAVTLGQDRSVRLPQEDEGFPHQEHQGLFPFCTGCHLGAETGTSLELYPDSSLCVRCHDGGELDRVSWTEPGSHPSNLRFTHPEHARASEPDTVLSCGSCHSPDGAPRMRVRRAVSESCLSCHAHRAEEHLADADCTTCHMPLAETGFSLATIEELPLPLSHERDDFLASVHGELANRSTASCETCHTAERCTSCHVDAARQTTIGQIAEAPASMRLPEFEARYNTPESHRDESWLEGHGNRASTEACSTCHTQESCQSCHREPDSGVMPDLPRGSEVAAAGATVRRQPPPSHASPFFELDHGTAAATDPGSCTTCHTESSCTECHASGTGAAGWGEDRGNSFHPPNYLRGHASDAYSSRLECSNCHSTEVFCRDCHEGMGMGSSGRLGQGYHDAQPLWLFRHGQAARQGLESCASCHRQTDCTQCHSTIGAFRVNPHGQDFDAERYAGRNRTICFACHLQDPLEPGS